MRYTLFAFILFIAITLRAQPSGESIVHIIQPGETLSSIAAHYKITVNELQRLNPKTLKYVYAGMKLTIPAEQEDIEPQAPIVASEQPEQKTPKVYRQQAEQKTPVVASEQPEQKTPKVYRQQSGQEYTSEPKAEPAASTPPLSPKALKRVQSAIGNAGRVEVITADVAQQIQSEQRAEAPKPAAIATSDMVLCYQTTTQANPTTMKRAEGRLTEGQNKLTVWMQGDNLHLADSVLHIHTILLPNRNLVYIYSDLTNMGVKIDYDYYTALNMNGLAPAEKTGGFETRNYQVKPNGLERIVLNRTCQGYQGRIITTQQLAQVEIWQNRELPVTATMNCLLDGIVLEGLPMNYSIERRGMTGYALNAGDVKAQLTQMELRKVDDHEILPDATVRFTTSNDPAELASFYSDNLATLKRLGFYPASQGTK